MAHDFSLWQVILKGGWTIGLLLLMSILVFGVLIERWRAFRRASRDRDELMTSLDPFLSDKDIERALKSLEDDASLLGRTAQAGLAARLAKRDTTRAMERSARSGLIGLETNLAMLGTIGSIAPFVGLFGTVLGIIRAFRDLALANAGGAAVVSQGIAEALVATAAGLFVAISAVVIFNSFQSGLERLARETELLISDLAERLDR